MLASEAERARLNDLFAELCAIASPSHRERRVADRVAAELRDVGLVAVPDEILAAADPEAHALFRRHPVAGERILSVAESMRPVARLVRTCHERYDGTGFPEGLRGEEIPLGARIIGACASQP